MNPSETRSGRAWLGNFHRTDIEAATLLLDSLRVLSLREIHRKLREFLDRAVDRHEIAFPALVVPERKLASFEALSDRYRDLQIRWAEQAESDADTESEVIGWNEFASSAVAWLDFHPGAPVPIATAGSDAFVSMILARYAPRRGQSVSSDGRWITPAADIELLREVRCRSIIVLTDYVASGRQSESLATAIARNPTIRSWRSLHLVEIHVAALAAQRSGLERLSESRAIDQTHTVETAPSIATTIKDPLARDTVVELCQSYARREKLALGHDGSGGLLVTERRAPNNLPGILLQAPRNWSPLFPNREVPESFIEDLSSYRPSEGLQASAQRVGQLRLGRNERIEVLRKASRVLLQVLALVQAEGSDAGDLAETMGVDIHVAAGYLTTLQQWGLLDPEGGITADGRRELAANKRGRRWTTANLKGSSEPYYPDGLR